MSTFIDTKNIVINVLQLAERSTHLTEDSLLLGAITELDSITVASVIIEIEEHFEIKFEHDEINGRVFATLGSLVSLIDRKLLELQ